MGLSTVFRGRYAVVLAVGCLIMRAGGHAQSLAATTPVAAMTELSSAELPDAPQPVADIPASGDSVSSSATAEPPAAVTEIVEVRRKPASKYRLVVASDEVVPSLTTGDKLKASLISRISPEDIGATVLAAGWSHLCDSDPHYGTDKGAFGERLGALALKQTTSSFFSYGVYASLAHTDPRYYVMGRRESITRRAVYSASRILVARTDSGDEKINWPKLAGIATATALRNLYYPKEDRGFGNSVKAFGFSVGDSALTFELHEFLGDALRMVHGER